MWNWVWINSAATSTVGGAVVLSLFIWILQASIAAFLSASYRRVVGALSDPRHTLPLFAQPSARRFGTSGRTAANLRTHNTYVADEVIRNGGRRGEGDCSRNIFNRFKQQLNLKNTQNIVQESDQICDDYMEDEGMVGLKDKIQDVMKKLQIISSIGLYGMGGVGKTTLAKAVFTNLKVTGHFDYTCFIPDFKTIVSKYSGKKLTSRLLEDLKHQSLEVSKIGLDWFTLKGKNVLLVLDDVDQEHQLQNVPWKSGWFTQESRVIVTSRNKKLCERDCKDIFNVELLGDNDSQQLFARHAFEGSEMPSFLSGKNNPMEKILNICDNVPLALEVVGKYLCKETDQQIWISTLQKLKEGESIDGDLDNKLLTCLRLSYDALAEEERSIFLDASILFMGDGVEKILEIWTARWGSTVPSSWGNLIFKCLVKSVNGKVWVHEQFRILARSITCSKHKKMQLWTRVASPCGCKEILTTQTEEPNYAEGLIYVPRERSKFMVLNRDAFSPGKFPELRVLKIKGIGICGENMILPPKLIFLSWSGAPYAKCPFHLKDLKRLSILKLKHWNALEVLPNDLEHCTAMTRIQPKGCRKVKELPYGISNLKNLRFLGLKATSMEKLPESFGKLGMLETLELGETSISQLPRSVGNLKNLRILGLRETPLIELPPSVCRLRLLTDLDLSGTSVSYLPDAVRDVAGLKVLNLSDTQLVTLPESVGDIVQLRTLKVGSTALSSFPNSIGRLRDLVSLEISSAALQSLPESFGDLGNLYDLRLRCDALQSLPESFGDLGNLYDLELHCDALQRLPESFGDLGSLFKLNVHGDALQSLPESMGNLKELGALWIVSAKIESLPDSFNQLKNLVCVAFRDCELLSRLPKDFQFPLNNFAALNCKRLELGQIVGGTRNNVQYSRRVKGLSLDNYDHTHWDLLSQIWDGTGVTSPPKMQLFSNLWDIHIRDQDRVKLFPEHLMNALHQIDTLKGLCLQDFDSVTSLPHDFGCLLPPSIFHLSLDRFKSLEELPSSMGQIHQLQYLVLTGCVSLQRLPVSLWELPHLKSLDVRGCESLQMQPSSCIVNPLFSTIPGECESFTIVINNWMFFLDVVEWFGHISSLHIKFFVSTKRWLEITGRHPTAAYERERRNPRSYRPSQQTEWLEGDGIVECMKRMKVVCGDDTMIDAAETQVADLQFKLKLYGDEGLGQVHI